MKEIDKNNKIFKSEEFEKDKYKFYIILKNLTSDQLELYSDERNYIICRGRKDLPTWIWTKDNFDINVIGEIEDLIKRYLTDADKNKFTCKKELYDLLKQRNFENLNQNDYFEMGFLRCYNTKIPKECDGIFDIPTIADKDVLTNYWFNDTHEMKGADKITIQQAQKDIEEFLNSGRFFVLRNKDGKIVSMAHYNVVENQAKIGHVYTPEEERKKGYAANLIYQITNNLLSKDLIPLLYTDYNYIPSNRAYINAGYEDEGILINFSCSKKC